MDLGILGTGTVARVLGAKLVAGGHRVMLGSRAPDHAGARTWVETSGQGARAGTFAEAAEFGEALLLCVGGAHAVSVLDAAGTAHLEGKVVIDVTNPLDFSAGFPPSLSVCNVDSVGERLQRRHPEARIVKALNTVSNQVMISPGALPESHTLLICGDDPDAKAQVSTWLREWFGWEDILDLGGITNARGTEAWLLLWTRLYAGLGTPMFNLKIVRAGSDPASTPG